MLKYPYREPVSGFTHLVAAILTILGTLWLIHYVWYDPRHSLVLLVFGLSMLAVYVASSVMHLCNGPTQVIHRLRRYDHAAIYVAIAGSYTPFIYYLLDGRAQLLAFVLVWGLAFIGCVSKLVFFWAGHISTIMYLLMGWMGVLFAPAAVATASPDALRLIVGGGLTYTVGAVIYALKRPNLHPHFGHHEIWHLFVMGGTAFHFAAIMLYVA